VIVLDTTVLVYAVGGDHPLASRARGLIDAIAAGRLRATTTVEVIQEFTHVRARRRGRSDAAALGRAYGALLAPLLAPEGDALSAGLALFEESALGCFDAVLAATALARGADGLVTADGTFASVTGLDARLLDGDWVTALLASGA
jgi:predicted nucleic acid-binding protein